MKQLRYLLMLVFVALTSCEEVIEVDLSTAAPRLVIDASIDWERGSSGSEQVIKLTTTTGYYDTQVPKVSGAIVFIDDDQHNRFEFLEQEPGVYICQDFVPVVGREYVLTVRVEDQIYTATERLLSAPDVIYFEQNNDLGFGEDVIEIKYYYQDNPDEDNFYMDRFKLANKAFPFYDVGSDKFSQGNIMFGVFISDEIKSGDVLDFKFYQISERYHNYMSRLLEVANNGGLFQTNVGAVRGNIINTTDANNYALGYFRLAQYYHTEYTVE